VRPEIKNQIKMLGKAVAAEVLKRRDSHRRWLRLSPLGGEIQVLEVEVPVGVDPVDWPKSVDDYDTLSTETFVSLDEAWPA